MASVDRGAARSAPRPETSTRFTSTDEVNCRSRFKLKLQKRISARMLPALTRYRQLLPVTSNQYGIISLLWLTSVLVGGVGQRRSCALGWYIPSVGVPET